MAAVCVGDFNVDNTEWLRFSSSTTPESRELENFCCTNGLRQHVREPTRSDYLLDLVLSNFASGLTVKVVLGIHDNDHRAVIARIKVHIPASNPVRRAVFDFRAANWEALHAELRQVDWQTFFSDLEADSATSKLSDYILDAARRLIPEKHIYGKQVVCASLAEQRMRGCFAPQTRGVWDTGFCCKAGRMFDDFSQCVRGLHKENAR